MAMELFNMEWLTPILVQLGMGAIFLYLFLKEREYNREVVKNKDETIKIKDDATQATSDKVLRVIEENTKSNTQLASLVANNTDVMKGLSERVYDVLTQKDKR